MNTVAAVGREADGGRFTGVARTRRDRARGRAGAARANKNAGTGPAFGSNRALGSALASLEARVRLADHEDLAAAADDLAVAMAGLRRLEGRQDFHGDT